MRQGVNMPQSKLSNLLVTMWLLATVATKSHVDELFQNFTEYEIVYPRIIKDYLSSPLRDQRLPFVNYSRNSWEHTIYVIVKNWTLMTTMNDRLTLSKDLINEREYFDKSFLDCDLRYGILKNNENSSCVVLTICLDEIYAFIIVDGRSFFVEPLTNGRHIFYESNNTGWWSSKQLSKNFGPSIEISPLSYEKKKIELEGPSRRSKRDIPSVKSNGYYNLTGDVIDMENFNLEPENNEEFLKKTEDDVMIERLPSRNDPEDIGYFSNPSWSRTKVPKRKQLPPRWLEVAIAVDYSVIEFHGPRVQQYVLALLNIVSAVFRDPSLDSNMVLVVARVILYADKKDSLVQDGNSRKSLENVNKWNRKLLSLSKNSHDIAIWLTRLDIGGPSGYAPVSGVCNPARSCTLNRDEGLTSAFIIAHEVAHILGLTHDGDKTSGNFCVEEASLGSVMAPMVAATFHHFYWSTCSRKEFHRKVKQWSCLLNRPNTDNNITRLDINVQEMFTMDEQCRVEFGQGYHLCKSFEIREPCSRLWCGNSNISQVCKTKKGPPMEGTLCGQNKWCVNGRCETMDRERSNLEPLFSNPRNGGWSDWNSWGKCSRSCGIGVQCRSRTCNNPRPAYGGKYCMGPNEDCKICESPKCSTNIDLRAQQCSRLIGSLDFKEISSKLNMTWLAYEPEEIELKCRLICRSKETGEIFSSKKNLMNGTPCSYGSTDICIQGECRHMGCDNIFNSEKILDNCGTCNGNDTDCDYVLNKFQRKLRRAMTRLAVLPRNGINMEVNITILKTSFVHKINTTFVIMDARKRRHKINNFDRKNYELLVVEGTAIQIQIISNNKYNVKTRGMALDDVIVSFVVPPDVVRSGTSIAVSSRYSINRKERNTEKRYLWLEGGWNFCSVSCGGGIRRKMIACKDDKTGRIVSRRKCAFVPKPTLNMEICNIQSCDYKWLPGPWETCSASCGHFGIQTRQVHCVRSSYNESEIISSNELEAYRIILRPSLCMDHQRPNIEQECNRVTCSNS